MHAMPILDLALKSLLNRRATALLTVFTIAVSIVLVLGVEKVRTEARASFTNTISGTDLIVGARRRAPGRQCLASNGAGSGPGPCRRPRH
jgi:putative ABC transport system permease protein